MGREIVRIAKPLPGEFEGTVDPEDYGFSVIKDDPHVSEEEQARQVAVLYENAKARTGVVIPSLEAYLESHKIKRFGRDFGATVSRQVKRITKWRGLDG